MLETHTLISLTLNVLCNWHLRDTEAQFQGVLANAKLHDGITW